VFYYQTNWTQVVLPGKEENELDVFDNKLNHIFTISVPLDTRSVEPSFKNRYIDEFKFNSFVASQNLNFYQPFIFPDTYSAIAGVNRRINLRSNEMVMIILFF